MKRIIFTVTTDLSYDQRMMRICGSMSAAGYDVLLVGRNKRSSLPLQPTTYRQKRLNCWFEKGKAFYIEYNIRLFFFLLFAKCDCICSIDLDSIVPGYLASVIRSKKRVYDAHEYFSQLDEVISRPGIYKVWHWVERTFMPRFPKGYTVCVGLADEFKKHYGVTYEIVRNVPVLREMSPASAEEKFVLYQGAVNKGRGLDQLVKAMEFVNARLVICGDGNFMDILRNEISKNNLSHKVQLKGMMLPEDLRKMTSNAFIAINPFEPHGLNQYLSLPNKFFDYIHACVPQVTMNYPEYKRINDEFDIAVLIDDLEPKTIADGINMLFNNSSLHQKLKSNCVRARQHLNWQKEELKLIGFYKKIFNV